MNRWVSLGLHGLACGLLVAAPACHDSRAPQRGHAPVRGPRFPGAGTSGSGLYLSSGAVTVSCDQPGPLPAGTLGPAPGATDQVVCYYDADDPDPAAVMEWIVESAEEGELIHARLTFNPRFVDNTYGAEAIGWTRGEPAPAPMAGAGMTKPPKPGKSGHNFKDLVGSDHAEFTFFTPDGEALLKFKADYLSQAADAPSGYASLGVWGGDGKMLTGSAEDVVAVSTSLERNLNQCGLGEYVVDSPATDDDYTPNPAAPAWDYRVVYDVWVRRGAFDARGFERVGVEFVHASPSKAGSNTIEVTPRKCPPIWPPPGPPPDELPPDDEADAGCIVQPDAPCDPGTWEPPDGGDAGGPVF